MRGWSAKELPGICIGCGRDTSQDADKYRDTAGYCGKCHNENAIKWQENRKKQITDNKQKGIDYWNERGIKPGDAVKYFAISWTGLGGELVTGTAKVGCNGAYVSSPYQPGKLAPGGWKKIEPVCAKCEAMV